VSADAERYAKLLAALYTDNDGVRNAAASKVFAWMKEHGAHPGDFVVEIKGARHARTERVIARLEEEVERLRKELKFFRENAGGKLREEATKAGLIQNRWEEFAAIVCDRLGLTTLPARGWQERVLKMTGVSKSQLLLWRKGIAEIPEAAFVTMRSAPVPEVVAKPRRRRASKPPKPPNTGAWSMFDVAGES
jgi:hypothetical protein